jgi:DNA-binding LacI/PurR family transcriptional regulator
MTRGRPTSFPAVIDSISALKLRPGARLPGEYELADRLGVHRLTLRKALADLRRQGLIESRAGKGHFWVGHAGVRHLGLSVHHLPAEGPLPPYTARVLQGVHEGAGGDRIHWVHFASAHAKSFLDRTRLDALAVLSPNFPDNAKFLQELRGRGLPLVTVNHFHPGVDGIMADHLPALEILLSKMNGRGRRRLAFLAHTPNFQDVGLRFDRMVEFAEKNGMILSKNNLIYTDLSSRAIKRFAARLSRTGAPDAILVAHPPVLFDLWDALPPAIRRRVGKEILIACLSDHPRLEALGVTAVNQPLESMGAWAAKRLTARLEDPRLEIHHERLPCAVQWRPSLAERIAGDSRSTR